MGALLTPVDGALELTLVHLRAAWHVHPPGLVVELLLCPALRPGSPRALPAAAARRHVLPRQPRRLFRLAGACSLLVDGSGRDLLRPLGRRATLLRAVLDVLVLAFTLVAPCLLRHHSSFASSPSKVRCPARPI